MSPLHLWKSWLYKRRRNSFYVNKWQLCGAEKQSKAITKHSDFTMFNFRAGQNMFTALYKKNLLWPVCIEPSFITTLLWVNFFKSILIHLDTSKVVSAEQAIAKQHLQESDLTKNSSVRYKSPRSLSVSFGEYSVILLDCLPKILTTQILLTLHLN